MGGCRAPLGPIGPWWSMAACGMGYGVSGGVSAGGVRLSFPGHSSRGDGPGQSCGFFPVSCGSLPILCILKFGVSLRGVYVTCPRRTRGSACPRECVIGQNASPQGLVGFCAETPFGLQPVLSSAA